MRRFGSHGMATRDQYGGRAMNRTAVTERTAIALDYRPRLVTPYFLVGRRRTESYLLLLLIN